MYGADLLLLVRQLAQEAALSSEAWSNKTDGGERVSSHDLRSIFMNLVDPEDKTSTRIFPDKAPFHPNTR